MIDPTLPLIDLHRHLDGSVRLETILELGDKHGIALPARDIEGLRPHVQVMGRSAESSLPGVMAFIAKFRWMTAVMVDYSACRRIAYENVQDAWREGIDYVELRFSPWFMAETHHLDPAGVVEAILDGFSAATRDMPIRANLIGILSRTYGPGAARLELEALLAFRDGLVALDLAGDEANWPGALFVDHVRRARDAGLQITVHAGESAGPESVWQAIRELGASRIGHAVSAIQDTLLVDHLASSRIGVEVSLTSNVQTATVVDYPSHPARRMVERGVLVTLNTDDPGISQIDLRHEYEVAAPAAGLSPSQIQQVQRNALAVAFLEEGERQALLAGRQAAPGGAPGCPAQNRSDG